MRAMVKNINLIISELIYIQIEKCTYFSTTFKDKNSMKYLIIIKRDK